MSHGCDGCNKATLESVEGVMIHRATFAMTSGLREDLQSAVMKVLIEVSRDKRITVETGISSKRLCKIQDLHPQASNNP